MEEAAWLRRWMVKTFKLQHRCPLPKPGNLFRRSLSEVNTYIGPPQRQELPDELVGVGHGFVSLSLGQFLGVFFSDAGYLYAMVVSWGKRVPARKHEQDVFERWLALKTEEI